MIEKYPTQQELVQRSLLACQKALGSVVPLDMMHMMGAGCHLHWGLYDGKFGARAENNIAVFQSERAGKVIVFEARPEGNTVTRFSFNSTIMREYYQNYKNDQPQ